MPDGNYYDDSGGYDYSDPSQFASDPFGTGYDSGGGIDWTTLGNDLSGGDPAALDPIAQMFGFPSWTDMTGSQPSGNAVPSEFQGPNFSQVPGNPNSYISNVDGSTWSKGADGNWSSTGGDGSIIMSNGDKLTPNADGTYTNQTSGKTYQTPQQAAQAVGGGTGNPSSSGSSSLGSPTNTTGGTVGGGGMPGGSAPKSTDQSSSLGSSSLGGNSSSNALTSLLGSALGATGLGSSGSLNPSGNYGTGHTQTDTTMVGTNPNDPKAGALGQLFNAYTQGALTNQTNMNSILGGSNGNNGLLSELQQMSTNPIMPGEAANLTNAQTLMAGPTALGQATTEGYENAYLNPQTANDTSALGVYGQAAGAPSQAAQDLYGDTSKYGSTITGNEQQVAAAYQQMLTQGYDPATAQAIIQAGLVGAASPFENQMISNQNAALATNNPLVAAVGGSGIAAAKAKAMADAGRQAQIAIGQQAIASKQAGASGLTNLQALENAQQQYGLTSRQSQLGQQQQYQLAGAGGLESTAQNLFGRQMQGLAGTSAQNQQQVAQELAGNTAAQNWYNQMFGRMATGTGQQAGLYGTMQQGQLGQLAGAGNVGTKPVETYTSQAGQGVSSTGGAVSSPVSTVPDTGYNIDPNTGLPYTADNWA